MAAGVATGIAALVWSIEPTLVSEDVRRILNITAVPLDGTNTGSGRVDAHAAVRSVIAPSLSTSTAQVSLRSTTSSEPFTTTVALTNDSLTELPWNANLTSNKIWIDLSGADAGVVRHGEPAYVSMVISPTLMTDGIDRNMLRINWESGTSGVMRNLNVFLVVLQKLSFFPQIDVLSDGSPVAAPKFVWIEPISPEDREVFVLLDGSSLDAGLPFEFPIGEDSHNRVRLHADGFLTFPGNDLTTFGTNYCTMGPDRPQDAILGWMADLDPSQPGAQISGFPAGADRYVFEYLNVPTANGVTPAYEVSFQIILDDDGDIRLSYRDVATGFDRPPLAAVGVESTDGRFHNYVFCADGETTLGILPNSTQTLHFTPGDLY